MQEITKILSSLRHPTQSFVNEDTFPSAIEAMPALKSVAASGFRGDKTFDDGFMSVASAAYDALTDSSIPGLESHLAKMTIAAVNSIDAQLQNDKDFAKKAISELNISRFLKSKANDAFKAGALLAMATIAYSDEFPPDDDDDKDREVVKEKPLGVPVEEPKEETNARARVDAAPSVPSDDPYFDVRNLIMLKDALPLLVTPDGKKYFIMEFNPVAISGIIYIEISILFKRIAANDLFVVLKGLEDKGLRNPFLDTIHNDEGNWIAIKFFALP